MFNLDIIEYVITMNVIVESLGFGRYLGSFKSKEGVSKKPFGRSLKDILVEEESRELMEGSPEEVEEPDIILSRSRCYEQSSMFVESTL